MSFWQELLQFGQWELFRCWRAEQQYHMEQDTGNPHWSLSFRSWFPCWTVQKFDVKELSRGLPRLLLKNLNCVFWGPSRSSWSLLSLSKEKKSGSCKVSDNNFHYYYMYKYIYSYIHSKIRNYIVSYIYNYGYFFNHPGVRKIPVESSHIAVRPWRRVTTFTSASQQPLAEFGPVFPWTLL